MKVYPPRDIRPFVMYCVNGKPRSSLLIESTDSMIIRRRIKKPKWRFLLREVRTETALLWRCYTLILLEISRRTRWWCLKCVIVYLARHIRPFVMYYVNGKHCSSLLIESTNYDSSSSSSYSYSPVDLPR